MHGFRGDVVGICDSIGHTPFIDCAQGQAYTHGVPVGTCILTVGCWNAIGQPLDQVIHALKFAPRPVTVTFVRPDKDRHSPFSKVSATIMKRAESAKRKYKTAINVDMVLDHNTELAIEEV